MALNPEIYAFEDAMETAVESWLLANGINDPAKQQGEGLLVTPRVEIKFLSSGFAGREHYYNPSQGVRWLDIAGGLLILKIVTQRTGGVRSKEHASLRGGCRWLMQHANELSDRMPLHRIEKIIESQNSISFQDDQNHDISALGFDVAIRIRPEAFPT